MSKRISHTCFILLIMLLGFQKPLYAQISADSVGRFPLEDSLLVKFRRVATLTVTTSLPGARVYLDSLFVGVTPSRDIIVKPGNYLLKVLNPHVASWEASSIVRNTSILPGERLELNFQIPNMALTVPPKANDNAILLTRADPTSSFTPLYAAVGTGLLSGVASAFLKQKADRVFDDYQQTSDPSLLDNTRRYDRWSGVALMIFELSFAALTYLLLSE
jgi:hypothetical protein